MTEKLLGVLFRLGVLAACTVLTIPGVLFAQGTTGAIEATVLDTSGSVVPGAVVTALNPGTGAEARTTTDEVGRAQFLLLRVGTYRVTVEHAGFEKLLRDDVVVNATRVVRLDLRLAVGAVTETVTVSEATPLLQSENATVGHVVEQRQINSIPLATRNFTQLLGTTAGVMGSIFNADNPGTGSDTVSVNGARRGSNSLLVDGGSTDNALNNSPGSEGIPSLEFLSEFRILTSLYGAEYGKVLGSIVNVTTRAGTNQFHGAAYEFLRNTRLNARPFFNPKRGQNVQNQFGANLGGPVRKNRTFFFGGWESSRQRNANAGSATLLTVVPTSDQRNGNFGSARIMDPTTGQPFPNNTIPQSRMSATSTAMQNKLVPLPNYTSGGATNFFAFQSIPTNIDQYTIRGDHHLGEKDTVWGRYFESRWNTLSPFGQGLPGFGSWTKFLKRTVSTHYTHIFSPTLVLETSFAYNLTFGRQAFTDQTTMESVGLKPLPNTLVTDGLPWTTISNYFNFGNYQRWVDRVTTSMLRHDMTWTRGRHNIKFGSEIRPNLYSNFNTLTARGLFNYSGAATGNSYADFLLGYTRNKTFGDGPSKVAHRDWAAGFYISDEWRVNTNLTVTAGLRYEPYWQPATYNLAMTNWWPDLYKGVGSVEAAGIVQGGKDGVPASTVYNDMNNFMPRLGIAWRLGNNWVIRAGAGLYFDQRTGQIAQQAFNNPPVFTSVQIDCAVAGAPCNLTAPDNWTFVNPGYAFNYNSMERNLKTDNAWQYNFSIQRELPRSLLIETAYIGTKGTHLMATVVGNPLIPVGFDPKDPKPGTLVRKYPGLANNSITGNGGSSSYHSFQLTVKKRVGSGTVQAAYTFAKTLSNGGEGNRAYTSMALTPWWDWSRARGPAEFDRPQRLVVTFTQDLPKFVPSGPARHVLNGWAVSGMLIAQGGTPLSVTNQTSGQGLGGAATSPGSALYSNVTAAAELVNPGEMTSKLNNYINKSAWSKAPFGTVGNSGRGMFRGPGQTNLDFSLFKYFPIREGTRLEFRGEFFNIANHPNFGNPSTSMDAANFGQITSTTVNGRIIQFALKLAF